MTENIKKLVERCSQSSLTTKEYLYKSDLNELDEDDDQENEIPGLIIQIPEERDTKNIIVLDNDEISKVLESKFEQYKFIKGFEAIWSAESGVVEGEIQSDDILRSGMTVIRRLQRFLEEPTSKRINLERGDIYAYEFPSPSENIKITIGTCSLEFAILTGYSREMFILGNRLRPKPTIRIEGLNISTHDQSKKILSSLANSVFFQIDLSLNIPIHLTMDRELFRNIRIRRKVKQEATTFKAPKYEYDHEPMSLYWYARTANNMPLLQYLAFYQVIEFYFPQYSYMDAQQRIKNLLKHPTFDANKDSDISHILSIIQTTAKGKSFGNESDQLKATIMYCIDKAEMAKWLTENDERKDFFDIQKKTKGLAKHKVSLANSEHDTRFDVAQRIYEIRCRIVHTKDENELDLLLPFSLELREIRHDLELVEFLARKAIIAGGRQLVLNM